MSFPVPIGLMSEEVAEVDVDAYFWISSEGVSPGTQAANELTGNVTFSGDVSYTNEYVRSGKSAAIDAGAINRNFSWDSPFALATNVDYTFEAWIYNDSSSSSGQHLLYLAPTEGDVAWSIGTNRTRVYLAGTPSEGDLSALPLSAWYHFMAKNVSGTLSFYLNKNPTPVFSKAAVGAVNCNGLAYLGASDNADGDWRGSIDSMRLSPGDVAMENTLA